MNHDHYFSGPPEAPTNCSVVNQTTDSLEVECLPGFDGGLDQHFVLEVADLQSKVLLANATDKLPEFTVRVNKYPFGGPARETPTDFVFPISLL